MKKTKKIILDKLDANCKIKCNLVYGKLSEMISVSPLTAAK